MEKIVKLLEDILRKLDAIERSVSQIKNKR